VGPAAAIAILYMATIGSLLTFSVGSLLATYFQDKEPKPEKTPEQEQLAPPSPRPSGGRRESMPGSSGKKEKMNLLTGVSAKEDVFLAPAEVVVDAAHRSPSAWATGTAYSDDRPEPETTTVASGADRVGPL